MPIEVQEQFCPNCGGCCVEACLNEIKCLYDCCGCCTIEVVPGPNQTLNAGTILAENLEDQCFYAYDPTNDLLDCPAGVLRYRIETDADGNILNNFAPLFGEKCGRRTTNMYICAIFRTQDLHGNVAAAFAKGSSFGRVVTGTPYSNGIVRLF